MSAKRTASGLVKDGSPKAARIKAAVAKIEGLPATEATRALVHSVVICRDGLAKLLEVPASELYPLGLPFVDNDEEWEPSVAAVVFGMTAAAECVEEEEEFHTSIEAMECVLDRMDSSGTYTEEDATSMLEVINGECEEVPEYDDDALTAVLSTISDDHVPAWVSDAVAIKFKALYPNSVYAVDNRE